jgi:hypothetical protein
VAGPLGIKVSNGYPIVRFGGAAASTGSTENRSPTPVPPLIGSTSHKEAPLEQNAKGGFTTSPFLRSQLFAYQHNKLLGYYVASLRKSPIRHCEPFFFCTARGNSGGYSIRWAVCALEGFFFPLTVDIAGLTEAEGRASRNKPCRCVAVADAGSRPAMFDLQAAHTSTKVLERWKSQKGGKSNLYPGM